MNRDLRGTHLQALLGGGHSHRSSSTATTNISSDPLLSSFGLSFPTSDAPEPSKSIASIPDGASVRKETPAQPWESRYIYMLLMIMFSIFFVNCFYLLLWPGQNFAAIIDISCCLSEVRSSTMIVSHIHVQQTFSFNKHCYP